MENHYYDANGVYTSSAPANPGSLPPTNALRIKPPYRKGFWPVLSPDGKGWVMREDHRGRKGWLNGSECEITRPGPLPDGWSETRPEIRDTRGYREKRCEAFVAETDPILVRMAGYQAEAEAWKEEGRPERESEARDRFRALLRSFLEKREKIRSRYPESDVPASVDEDATLAVFPTQETSSVVPEVSDAVQNISSSPADDCSPQKNAEGCDGGEDAEIGGEITSVAPSGASEKRLYLTASGAYHAEGCRYTASAGEWMSAASILALARKTKPCALCRPGPLEGGE